MAILSNQRKGAGTSAYNFKNDVMMLLGWIENLRIENGGDIDEAKTGTIYIAGNVDLGQVNRVRRIAGMTELEPSPAKEA